MTNIVVDKNIEYRIYIAKPMSICSCFVKHGFIKRKSCLSDSYKTRKKIALGNRFMRVNRLLEGN